MTDFDSIWRTQDEIRTVVNAVLGECIWNLSYSERRMAIELELTVTLDDDAIGDLCCHHYCRLRRHRHKRLEVRILSLNPQIIEELIRPIVHNQLVREVRLC